MCAAGHWIDINLALRSFLLYFKRFNTPHTGDAPVTGIKSVLEEWYIVDKVYFASTIIASDIIKGISRWN